MPVIGYIGACAAVATLAVFASQPAAAAESNLMAAGEAVFEKCQRFYTVGAPTSFKKPGPSLNGSSAGSREPAGLREVLRGARGHRAGKVWDAATLTTFLHDPQGAMKSTRMAFSGLATDGEIKAVLAYLPTFDCKGTAPG